MKKLSIFILVVVGTLSIFMFNNISAQDKQSISNQELYQLFAGKQIEQKISLALELLAAPQDIKTGQAILCQIDQEKRFVSDPYLLVHFYDQVNNNVKEDPFVRASSLKNAASALREHHLYPDSRKYYEAAYQIHPERNDDEANSKASVFYQIIQDDWYSGRWEKGLEGFLSFASQYSNRQHKLHIYSFFEAIPTLVYEMDKERKQNLIADESTVIKDAINRGKVSENPGEVLSLAMIHFARWEFQEALNLAESIKNTTKDEWWHFLSDLLTANIHFVQKDVQKAKEVLDFWVDQGKYDDLLTRFISVASMKITQFYPAKYWFGLDFYNWYLNTSIYQDIERREKVSDHILAHILINYGIDLLYTSRHEQSADIIKEVYTNYPDTDMGQQAALILAEDFLNKGNLKQAESLVIKVNDMAGFDKEVKLRIDLVQLKIQHVKDNELNAKAYKQSILKLPDLNGYEELIRAKIDAKNY